MAVTLMDEWGVKECRDVGNMVFQLIEEQVFGRQESDKPEDFDGVFDFQKALREPFLPVGRELASISGTYRALSSPFMGGDRLVAKSVERPVALSMPTNLLGTASRWRILSRGGGTKVQ